MKSVNSLLGGLGTTIFTVMSALAVQHGSINLGQGFPDTDGPDDILRAAADALFDGRNQYPPMPGIPELRQAVAAHDRRFYGIAADAMTEVVVTSGATEAITACLVALLDPGDEVVLIEPLYDTYLPVVRLLGAVPRLVRLSPPGWELPRAELAAAFGPSTKAILLNTPDESLPARCSPLPSWPSSPTCWFGTMPTRSATKCMSISPSMAGGTSR